jgi:hypothetical protein
VDRRVFTIGFLHLTFWKGVGAIVIWPYYQRFKSLRRAARFRSVFSAVCNQFRPGRHALSAANYRTVMRRRWREWDTISETTAFSAAA